MMRIGFLLMVCFCFANIKGMDEKAAAEEMAQAPKMGCDLKAAFPTLPDEIVGTLATTRCLQKALRKNVTAYLLSNPDLAETDMENLRGKINPDDFEKILKRNKVLEKRYFIAENAEALTLAVEDKAWMEKYRNDFVDYKCPAGCKVDFLNEQRGKALSVVFEHHIVEQWNVKQADRSPIKYAHQLWSDGKVRLVLHERTKRRLQRLSLTQLKFMADLYRRRNIVCSAKDAEIFNSIEEQSIKEQLELNYPAFKKDTFDFKLVAWTAFCVCLGAASVGGLWWLRSRDNSTSK